MLLDLIGNVKDAVVLVVLFGVTIFVHELGHFLVALKCGMVVDTFSIGFGPAIWKKRIKGVVYKIGWIPFGGYVALPQLDPTGMATVQGSQDEESSEDAPRRLPEISPWKKILVSVAGATGNVILGIIIAWVFYLSPGAQAGAEASVLGVVATNSIAYNAGLRPGDRVVAVNDREVDSWYRFVEECIIQAGRREDRVVNLTVSNPAGVQAVAVEVVKKASLDPVEGVGMPIPARFGQVTNNSPEEAAGLMVGDLVVSLDETEVVSVSHLRYLSKGREGEKSRLGIVRNGTNLTVDVVLPLDGVYPDLDCMFGSIKKGLPADKAGLRKNDRVVKLNGEQIYTWSQFSLMTAENGNNPLSMVIDRRGRQFEVTVQPTLFEEEDRYIIGVGPGVRPWPPWLRYKHPMRQLVNDASGIWRVLSALFSWKDSKSVAGMLGGPVAIFGALWDEIRYNFFFALAFLRFLNINLAMLNLLPIPVLDGGHIVFSLWEGVTHRKVHPKLANGLVNVFAVLLIAAFVILTTRDVITLRKAKSGTEREADLATTNPPPASVTNEPGK